MSPSRPNRVGRELAVVVEGRPVGWLRSTGRSNVTLTYDIGNPHAMALSHALPLIGRTYAGRAVDNWISGLLPDRSEVLLRWRAQYGLTRMDTFALLWHVGEDVAGAAQFVRPDRLETVAGPGTGSLTPLSDDDIAARLSALRTDAAAWSPDITTGQFSLAGAQAKFALARTSTGWAIPSGAQPTTHIFKPAIPALADQDVCEHLTMRLAAVAGMPVAPTQVLTFAGQRALVVTRFDRIPVHDGPGPSRRRIHQEDICQALGLPPTSKYESLGGPGAATVIALLRDSVNPEHAETDVAGFVRALGFNWLVAGTDAHARNYALLHHRQRTRLAPLYDLNSFLPYQQPHAPISLAMRVGDYQTDPAVIGAEHWKQLAGQVRLDPAAITSMLRELGTLLLDVAPSVLVDEHSSRLPKRMRTALSKHVTACLRRL